jgi:UDP-glucose 4-epimerase
VRPLIRQNRRVLITGACGLIGRDVATQLTATGVQVLGLDLKPNMSGLDHYQHQQADVRDDARVQAILRDFEPTDVVHLAARHMIPECEIDPGGCWEVNVSATVAFVRLSVEAGARRFGLASSADVYAHGPESKTTRSPLMPASVYGRSKRAAEEVVRAVTRHTSTLGIVFRPFNVYGPRDSNPHLIPNVIDQTMRGGSVATGDLTSIRDYVYVADAASVIVYAMLSQSPATINIGTGAGHTGYQVVDLIRKSVGRDFTLEVDPQRQRTVDRARLVSCGAEPGPRSMPLRNGIQMTVQERARHGEDVSA